MSLCSIVCGACDNGMDVSKYSYSMQMILSIIIRSSRYVVKIWLLAFGSIKDCVSHSVGRFSADDIAGTSAATIRISCLLSLCCYLVDEGGGVNYIIEGLSRLPLHCWVSAG